MEELGPDFQKAQSLLFAEVAFLLDREQNKRAEGNSTEPSEMFMKTLKYTQRFSHFNELETIREVRNLTKRKQLSPEELASLANLFPHTAEEARTLIPSLSTNLEDHEIQEILNDMKSYESKYVFESK